jgi:hypothetical protein
MPLGLGQRRTHAASFASAGVARWLDARKPPLTVHGQARPGVDRMEDWKEAAGVVPRIAAAFISWRRMSLLTSPSCSSPFRPVTLVWWVSAILFWMWSFHCERGVVTIGNNHVVARLPGRCLWLLDRSFMAAHECDLLLAYQHGSGTSGISVLFHMPPVRILLCYIFSLSTI